MKMMKRTQHMEITAPVTVGCVRSLGTFLQESKLYMSSFLRRWRFLSCKCPSAWCRTPSCANLSLSETNRGNSAKKETRLRLVHWATNYLTDVSVQITMQKMLYKIQWGILLDVMGTASKQLSACYVSHCRPVTILCQPMGEQCWCHLPCSNQWENTRRPRANREKAERQVFSKVPGLSYVSDISFKYGCWNWKSWFGLVLAGKKSKLRMKQKQNGEMEFPLKYNAVGYL